MPNLDERVASVEGRVQEQAARMTDFGTFGVELRQDFRASRDEVRQAIAEVREEMRQGFNEVRQEMRSLRDETRESMRDLRDEMDRRFDRMDRHFAWLVGIVVTGFIAVIGTVAGAFWGLLQTVR